MGGFTGIQYANEKNISLKTNSIKEGVYEVNLLIVYQTIKNSNKLD